MCVCEGGGGEEGGGVGLVPSNVLAHLYDISDNKGYHFQTNQKTLVFYVDISGISRTIFKSEWVLQVRHHIDGMYTMCGFCRIPPSVQNSNIKTAPPIIEYSS